MSLPIGKKMYWVDRYPSLACNFKTFAKEKDYDDLSRHSNQLQKLKLQPYPRERRAFKNYFGYT